MNQQTENINEQGATAPQLQSDDFASLLKREFKPKTYQLQNAVEEAVQTLSQHALRNTSLIVEDTYVTIESLISQIDKKLSEQINAILHHEKFIQLESSWRGLYFLVNNTETDEMLKIRFFNASKKEMYLDLRKYKGVAWDQSPLFKKVYEQEYGQFGGEPYGMLLADYYFDHSPQDVALISAIAKIAAAAHSPLITAADPAVMMMASWAELANPREISKLFSTPDYIAWRDFRASEDSRYVGLTLPRFLARLPYGASTLPVEEFHFEEMMEGKTENFVWSNAAYAMGVNINRSFKSYGWCSRIRGVESGGTIEDLPVYVFPSSDGGVDVTCPTEIAISDRRELELAKSGFMPLIHRKNSSCATFIGAQSLHSPQEYDDPQSTANANLAARLPYLFATCRFAHYLKCMVRDKIGSFKTREIMEGWLNNWVTQYVEFNPAIASDESKARRPLAAAQVVVEEDECNPGYYRAKFFLQPHYQLEGLTVSLRLTAKLPSAT